jgi:hypothetical protein
LTPAPLSNVCSTHDLLTERRAALRNDDSFGGGGTQRARVVRDLIDEFVEMRRQLAALLGDDPDDHAPPFTEPAIAVLRHPSSG